MRFRRPPLLLWRYVGLEVVAILVTAIVVQAMMNVGIAGFQLIQQEGLRLAFIWPLLLKISTLSLYYTIPISLLFAVTLGVGRMVADLEITALKASGISYAQILAPSLILAAACALFAQRLNAEVIPPIRYEKGNLKKIFLRQLKNLGHGGERTIVLPKGMGQIHCSAYRGNVLEKVLISVWNLRRLAGGPDAPHAAMQELPIRIRAERARVESLTDPDGQEKLVVELYDADISVPDDVLLKKWAGPS